MKIHALAPLLLSAASLFAQTVQAGPNIWVNRDTGWPTREPVVASDPNDASHLIAGVIQTGPESDAVRAYASRDYGNSWQAIPLPALPTEGSADPQVAFDAAGSAYFEALAIATAKDQRPHLGIYIYRAASATQPWKLVEKIGADLDVDHPQMVIDSHHGATKIYTTATYYDDSGAKIALFTTGTKTNTQTIASSSQQLFNLNPLLLNDGTVFIPYTEFAPSGPNQHPCPSQKVMFVMIDGQGRSAVSAQPITTISDPKSCGGGSPYTKTVFAVGRSKDHERIYMVTNNFRNGRYGLTISHSDDHGRSWSAALDVAPYSDGDQFRPAVAVSPQGILGIAWCDSRDSQQRMYREFFAVSTNGGESFSPAVPVSAEYSPFQAAGNDVPAPSINSPAYNSHGEAQFWIEMVSASTDAGEYTGLTADDRGVFHPLWSDARRGSFQAWTAEVHVNAKDTVMPQDARRMPVLGQDIVLVLDQTTYDASSQVESIPIRLKNISANRICPPLKLVVVGTANSQMPHNTVLNSDNGKDWDGAVFDYSRALGDQLCLEPGSVSGALVWQIRTIATPFSAQRPWASLRLKVDVSSRQ